MAAPTQEYPPWLTPVPTTIFDGNGVPIHDFDHGVILAIDLLWAEHTLGFGLDVWWPDTASIHVTACHTSGISITTAIPSSSSPTLTSSATPSSSLSSSVSLSTSSTTSLSSQSSTPTTATPAGSSAQNLSRGQLIGVIVASILGFIFLLIVAILLYLCCKGRRSRRSSEPSFTPAVRGLDEGYEIVSADGRTTWAEGSPRQSGEEADPFLRRGGAGTPPQPPDPEMGGRPMPPYVGIARVPVPPPGNGSQSSGGSSGTNHSGYGTLIDRPTLNLLPSTAEELDRQRRGHILSLEELQRMDEESVLPLSAEYSPLVPPPRLVDPDLAWGPGPGPHRKSSQFSLSAYPDAYEAPTVLTARRVRAEDLASRSPPQLTQPLSETRSNGNSGGLLSALGLGRLSWLKNLDSSSKRNSRTHSFRTSTPANDDPEVGVALLSPPEMSESQTSRRLGLGLAYDGERPVSTASGRSAATVYHDAYSSLPGTPASGGTPLVPPPRALAPSAPPTQPSAWPSSSTVPIPTAPAPPTDLPEPSHSYSTSVTHVNQSLPADYDVLDMPVPARRSHFASTATLSMSSLRETVTGSSNGLSVHPFPPGLGAVPKTSWTDESSTLTHVNPPVSLLSNQDTAASISIDVLEEAPPVAGEGWRSLAAEQGIFNSRRATFGQYVPPSDFASEEASLYSMRSPISPAHSRSTGSAPSRRDLSGSTSSHPSAFSTAARTHSSGHSLAHSGSISSDARKRGAPSPAMSAFGSRSRPHSPPAPVLTPPLNAPPTAHFATERAGTHRMATSLDMDDLAGGRMSSPEPTSPLSQLSSAPEGSLTAPRDGVSSLWFFGWDLDGRSMFLGY
ncbi:hypothetical protein LshimejAT787_1801210 [Lyophyllum shimeji]|uniref:Uncharacterized protein n=1 Tax=Lyophyllum shimeji TaxID=47721 RepID=A0A9P3UR79_LYOSH|nr:hypothetical protein LshimejAT787_1801210 [Lyophyllum shimeji]